MQIVQFFIRFSSCIQFFNENIFPLNMIDNESFKIMLTNRLPAKNDPAPPLGNFADIVYLKKQSFLHRIRDVCTW